MASVAAIIKHRTSAKVVAKLMYAQFHAHAATWHEERGNGCTQVVAGLLHDEFPSAIIQADQVAGPNFLFTQHLDNAQKPGTAQWDTLGHNSTDHWDFVLFQVRSFGERTKLLTYRGVFPHSRHLSSLPMYRSRAELSALSWTLREPDTE